MPSWLGLTLLAATGLAGLAWLAVLLDPTRAWRLRPVAEDAEPRAAPTCWPPVCVIVPAHDEEEVVGESLASLLGQDYAGEWRVVVVDERSGDRTGELALELAASDPRGARLSVVRGAPIPRGWVGKVWGLEQGRRAALASTAGPEPEYFLLTDADISHAAGALSTLVRESETSELALNSRMARLHCESLAERLLIPAFVLFFNLLYPMRKVNDPASPVAAAAGGCVLVRASVLEAIDGFERIQGEIIDDVNLARAVADVDPRLRLAVSRSDVRSLRRYSGVGPIWRMVRRTAFDELDYSWLKLAGIVATMLVLFLLPPVALALSVALSAAQALDAASTETWGLAGLAGVSLATLVFMRILYEPTRALFGVSRGWAWSLPLAGVIYGAITLDSARQHLRGRSGAW
jgi:hopene-associated glycosyltransferase HpnB